MKNKFGWEKKDFESCLEKVSYPNKIKSNNYLQKGKFPIVSQDENLICGFWEEESDVLKIQDSVVVFGDHTRALKYVDFDFVVGADGVRVLLPKSFLRSKFLYYYLKWVNVPSLGYSRHYKLLKELNIPIPSLPTQHQIVSELDALSEIISKKKQQLEELDKLAQATFYDMFGDPVTNEKGWKKCCINSVCNFTQGIQIGLEQQFTERDDNCNRFLRISDYTQDCEIRYVRENNSKYLVKEDDVVIVRYGASAGFVGINKTGVLANNLFKLNHDRKVLNNLFLYNQLQLEHYKSFILKVAFGAAMPALSFTVFKHFEIVIPPLALQNHFASKIESIESQKSLITQSIEELQQLFDYTMDKYFN